MKLVQKACKAQGCNKTYIGAPQSKFCSPECKKKGVGRPKFEPTFTIIAPTPDVLTVPAGKEIREENAIENKRPTLSIPTDKKPVVLLKPNSTNLIQDVKNALIRSTTLEQIISNIATKHKYKKPESYVSHIEDMLILYAQD